MDVMLEKIKGCVNQIPPKRIVEIIVKYGYTLSDFSDMEPSKLNKVIQLLEEYNQKKRIKYGMILELRILLLRFL